MPINNNIQIAALTGKFKITIDKKVNAENAPEGATKQQVIRSAVAVVVIKDKRMKKAIKESDTVTECRDLK